MVVCLCMVTAGQWRSGITRLPVPTNPTHLSLTKGFTLQASIRNLTTSMCPRNGDRREMSAQVGPDHFGGPWVAGVGARGEEVPDISSLPASS